MEESLRAFSDQQIITGIAILGAGFLETKSISVYHYQLVVYLAWMSSNVHLATLTLLRNYLRAKKFLLAWRVTGMLILFVMLCIALVPTSSDSFNSAIWYTSGAAGYPETLYDVYGLGYEGSPLVCFWQGDYVGEVNPSAILSYILLGSSYIWKVAMLFDKAYNPLLSIRYKSQRLLERGLRKTSFERKWPLYYPLLAVYIVFIAMLDWLESFAASICILTFGLVWGTLNILVPRRNLQAVYYLWGENTWTFGQTMPLLLLALPILSFVEPLYGKYFSYFAQQIP